MFVVKYLQVVMYQKIGRQKQKLLNIQFRYFQMVKKIKDSMDTPMYQG